MPGGIGNQAFCLAKELSDLKHEVTVLTEQRQQKQGDWKKFLDDNADINIIGIRRRSVSVLTYLLRFLSIYKLLNKFSYKAVIFSGKFSVWLNGIAPKTKSIVVIHGSEIKQKGILKSLFYKGLKRADDIVCVSNFTKEQLIAHYQNIDRSKIVVINNGIKNDWIGDKQIKKPSLNKLNLITVGGIHKRKGQFNVVRALPEIIKNFPDTKYHIVGLPLEKEALLNLINEEKITDHVIFHHGLSEGQMRDVLLNSHVFMMLSEQLENGDFEGFGIAAMEAMALGLPAIGTRNSGIADAIKDGYSGRLVDPKSTEDIVKSLKEIISDYRQYSANAGSWADNFRWTRKITEYQALIEKL